MLHCTLSVSVLFLLAFMVNKSFVFTEITLPYTNVSVHWLQAIPPVPLKPLISVSAAPV